MIDKNKPMWGAPVKDSAPTQNVQFVEALNRNDFTPGPFIEINKMHTANKFKMFWVRVFGKKTEKTDDDNKIVFYRWKGITYIDSISPVS